MSLFSELKRRNVFKVGIAYVFVSWLVLQVVGSIVPIIAAPEWVSKAILIFLMAGFPIALLFAWAFEITPEGVKKESEVDRSESITTQTSRNIDFIIIGALVLIIAGFIYDKVTIKTTTNDVTNAVTKSDNTVNKLDLNNSNQSTAADSEKINDKSIAVLPFTNRSNKPEDQFFVDGMHDDLLTKLAKSHQMRVISRTSVLEYRNTTKKIPEIALELGVSNILEGGVQRSGSHIRVNAQLINALTDEHLWAETYDKKLTADNVFLIQSEVTQAIAKALQATLSPEEVRQINKPLTNNLQAWKSYQKAYNLNLDNTYTAQMKIQKRMDSFTKAIELDPNFAAAYAQLAFGTMNLYWYNENEPQLRQQAWQAIEHSRALDDNSSELFVAEAAYYYWGFRDFKTALVSIKKAINIAPNSALAATVHGFLLRRLGRFDESIQTLDFATKLNPKSSNGIQENAETLVYLLRYKEAEKYIKMADQKNSRSYNLSLIKANILTNRDGDLKSTLKLLENTKDLYTHSAGSYWWTLLASKMVNESINFAKSNKLLNSTGTFYYSNNLMTGLSYFIKGDKSNTKKYLQLSITKLNSLLAKNAENKNYLVALCQAYAGLQESNKADLYCKKVLTNTDDLYDYPFGLISVVEAYAMLGDKPQALKTLQQALHFKIRSSENHLRLDPFLQSLQDEAEFQTLIKRIDSGELIE